MGEWEAWIKAGTGDDKTDIVVIADFWERTGGLFSRDRDLSANAFNIPWGGFDFRSPNFPGRVGIFPGFRLVPAMFFGPGGLPTPGVNTPLPHSAPNVSTSPFYKLPFVPGFVGIPPPPGVINPNTYWDQLFDIGLRGELGEFGDYFKTWNWELGFRYSRNEGRIWPSAKPANLGCGKHFWIRTQRRHLIRS